MNDSRLKLIATVDEVIDALGGGSAASRLAGLTPQSMTNARARGRLPYPTFLILSDELARRGLKAPAELWGIKPARKRRA